MNSNFCIKYDLKGNIALNQNVCIVQVLVCIVQIFGMIPVNTSTYINHQWTTQCAIHFNAHNADQYMPIPSGQYEQTQQYEFWTGQFT